MAKRPVFYISRGKVRSKDVEFEWVPGFAISQKKKNVARIHEKLDSKALEVSTKSDNPLGVKLSAFNLKYKGYTLENIFQSSKVFEAGGPYRDLLDVSARDAKRDPRLKASGKLVRFEFDGIQWPLEPKSVFYDYIYYNAVRNTLRMKDYEELYNAEYFSDVEFNPGKSVNTQARAIAIVKYVLRTYGSLPYFTPEGFIAFHKLVVN